MNGEVSVTGLTFAWIYLCTCRWSRAWHVSALTVGCRRLVTHSCNLITHHSHVRFEHAAMTPAARILPMNQPLSN